MKSFRLIFIFLSIALTLGIFYWFLNIPRGDLSQRIYQTIKEQQGRADLLFKKVTFEEVQAGTKYWQLEAEVGSINKSTGIATLQNANGTFFKQGKAALKFRSPAALWDMQKKEIFLDKPFGYDIALEKKIARILRNLKKSPFSVFNLPKQRKGDFGYWFQANNLSWKLTDQKLICRGGINLNKGEVSGFAEKLESDVGLESIQLTGNPHIIVAPAGVSPVTLEAVSFGVFGSQESFVAYGNPVVSWKDARITAQSARYLQIPQKLELNGNVNINYQDILARGNSADYFTNEQKIILSGEAHAEQANNHLSGDKVQVSLREKKIAVIGKSHVIIHEEEQLLIPEQRPFDRQEKKL